MQCSMRVGGNCDAELTKVNVNEIKLCCNNRLNISVQYCFRYNVEPTIAGDDAFGKLTIAEFDKLRK